MHIVFFNRSYYPDLEASGQFLTELAEDLAAKGEDVSVVCGMSYHVKGKHRRLPLEVETRNSVRVIRVSNTQLPKSSFICRLVNLGTYLAGCLLALCVLRRPDIVVSQTDPPLLPLLTVPYARLSRARFMFAINDLYPDVAIALGEISNPLWLKLLDFASRFGLRHADMVTVLGEDMKARVMAKGCPPQKIAVTRHWADVERIRPRKEQNEFRQKHGFVPSDLIIMYSGNVGLSQRLEDLIHVAREFRESKNVHFLIVGEGAYKDRLQAIATQLELNGRVRFFPYQAKGQLDQSLSAADLHVIPLAQGVAGTIVPCKMYGIMASGTPYLAIMDRDSEAVRVAEQYECGFHCPPNSRAELKEHIEFALRNRALLHKMGRNGRRAAEQEFSRSAAAERYHRLISSMV